MSEERGTFKDIVQDKTIATYRQVDYWISNGVPIGQKPEKGGSGNYRSYDALDVKILDHLAILSDLMGGSRAARSFTPMLVLQRVARQLRLYPKLMERPYFYVTREGDVHTSSPTEPCWVLALIH